MVDWAVAKIRWTIVHRVHQEIDEISKQAPPPILADLVSSLDSLSEKFIQNHILNSLDDYHIRRASFRDTANNPIRIQSESVFAQPDDESNFIAVSRTLAMSLYAAAQGRQHSDARILAGDLIVCLVDCKYVDEMEVQILAQLKIDPKDGFGAVEERDAQGRLRFALRKVNQVMTDSRLQKCAFVFPSRMAPVTRSDLMVLDLVTDNRNAVRWVASYFVDRFLNCATSLNPDDQLKVLIYEGGDWIKNQTWSDFDKERAKDRVVAAAVDNVIDVVALADQIITDEGQRQPFIAHLQAKGLTDLVFEPRSRNRRRLAEFVTYEGDNGLSLHVKQVDYGIGRPVDPGDSEDGVGIHSIEIKTTRWQQRR